MAVSNVNFLPSIVEDSGFILKNRNVDLLSNLINIVIKSDYNDLEQKARFRIVNNFSYENRKKILLNTLKE